jgi:uncharacterized OB-fold protein
MASKQDRFTVELYACRSCGHATAAARRVCSQCGATTIERASVTTTGKVIASANVEFPPANLKERGPYTNVLVELENGCRLWGILAGAPREVAEGEPVTALEGDELSGGLRVHVLIPRLKG